MKYIKGERIWCVSNIQSQVGRPAPVKVLKTTKTTMITMTTISNFLVLTFDF